MNSSPMSQSAHEADNEQYDFLRQVFDKFDNEKLGYVSVEAFMSFIKDSLASNLDENVCQRDKTRRKAIFIKF
jgi:Ca2+-binding EF-hand superfamily protein